MTPSLLSLFFLLLLRARVNYASSHPKISHFLLPRIANISSSDLGKTLSAAPTLSCYPQDQDPDQGILSGYCICNETISLPQLTPTPPIADVTSSCTYKTVPPCQTCTSLGFPENKCVSIPNCNPQATSTTLLSSSTEALSVERETSNVGSISFPTAASNETLYSAHAITAAPSKTSMAGLTLNSSLTNGDECLLQDAHCSLRGPGHSLDGLKDECVLWDTSCSGNRSLATSQFYGSIMNILTQNACFYDSSPDCSKSNPPGRVSEFDDVKSWMRSPPCMSEDPGIIELENTEDAIIIQEDLFMNQTCCGDCEVAADQVDVYYWSNPYANTSCLSIVGDGNSDLAVGATTDNSGSVYWGCTTWYSGSPSVVWTATLTSVASMTFRSYFYNPYDESPCGNVTAAVSSDATPKIKHRDLLPRGHTLIAPNSSVSTVVLGDVTFTSPSIYINFLGLHAGDNCGTTYISSTMMAFSQEELSTIAGHVQRFASSQQFNPADLPCPPQSIMSLNWYTPLPGVPYRPFFAFPEKIRQQIPFFKYCDAFWFSVFDPPRELVPGLALTPDVTTGDPKAPSKAPEPSHVPDPGPKKTAGNGDPAASPSPAAHPQSVPQPQNTAVPLDQHPADSTTPTPTDGSPVLPNPNAQGPTKPVDPQQVSSNDGDPAAAKVSGDPYDVQSPTSTTSNSQEGDPNDSTQNDPTVQDEGSLPTTIQLGPQPNQKPTTIYIGSGSSEEASTSGIGAIIYDAFGKTFPTTRADGVSGPQASLVDPAAAFPTITVAGQTLTISDPSAVSIAGTVLTPDGAEATISGTPVSLAPSGNLVIGTGPPHPSSTVLTIAGQTITANPTSFQIAGTPVVAGAPAVTVSGTPVSIGTAGDLVIGGTTSTPSPLAAVVTVGGQTLTANGADLVGSGTTVSAGGPAVLVAGTTVSLGPLGELVVGSTTTTISGASQPSIYTVGGQTFTANPTKFSVAGATLSAGGPGIMVSSTLISLNPSGSLVIGTSTIPLDTPTPTIITTDGQTFTVEGSGLVAIGGTTLSSGGAGTIISGTPISVGVDGSLVIGTSTIPLDTPIPTVITTDGQTFTVEGGGLIAIGGTTLSSGGAGAIISGTPISVGPSGLAIGSETVPLPTGNGSASSTLSLFTGTAARYDRSSRLVLWASLMVMVALVLGWR